MSVMRNCRCAECCDINIAAVSSWRHDLSSFQLVLRQYHYVDVLLPLMLLLMLMMLILTFCALGGGGVVLLVCL